MPVYKSMSDAILGKTWSGPVKLSKGQSVAMFLGVPSDDAVSKAVPKNFSNQVAQSLSGSVTYCKRTLLSGTCPSKISLEVTASGSKSSGASSSSSASSSSKKLEDLIRDAKLSHLRNLSAAALKPPSKSKETKEEEEKKEDPKATYEEFLKEMLTSDSTHIPLLSDVMKHREKQWKAATKEESETLRSKLVDAANLVIDNIDAEKVAQHFGVKNQPLKPDEKAKKKAAEMKKLRDQLKDALMCRCKAQISEKDEKKWTASLQEVQRWVDLKSAEYLILLADRALECGNRGLELQKLLEIEKISDAKRKQLPDKKLLERKLSCYESLGWDLWLDLGRSVRCVDLSKKYFFCYIQ